MTDERILSTKRLILRPVSLEDAAALYLVYGHPQAMQFMESPLDESIADTRARLERIMHDGACWWSICLPETGQAIGNVGYLGNVGVPGMGYILHPAYWQQGYMTEAVEAALDYGFSRLGLDRVELWINDDNVASQGLARKIGFARRGRFRMKYNHQDKAHDKEVFGMYRHEWRTSDGRPAGRPQHCYRLEPILSVPDVSATATFYRDQLDFTIDFLYGDPPTHGGIFWGDWTTEGARIQLSQADEIAPANGGVILFISVGPDIDALYELYQRREITITREIATYPWGLREFYIEDCNGYVLRFGSPV
jgi:ribosomal-protein-alanine N-acetyltransferase